jgi:hypothetical protein
VINYKFFLSALFPFAVVTPVIKNSTARTEEQQQPIDRLAKTYTISLLPRQQSVVQRRLKELALGRSVLFQILVDIEEREGSLVKEVKSRLRRALTTQRDPITLSPATADSLPPAAHD